MTDAAPAPAPAPEGGVAQAPTPGSVLYGDGAIQPPAAPEAPAAPETPAPETPAPETPAPETPAPEAPVQLDLKLPDGFTVDDTAMASLKEVVSDQNLSPQERGQKLVDLYAKQVEALNASNAKAWTDTQAGWQAELSSDPVLGGDKMPAALEVIGKAFDQYGDKDGRAREAFDITGAGNNPHIVRMIHKMAEALSEGTYVKPLNPVNGRGPAGKTAGQILYGNNNPS